MADIEAYLEAQVEAKEDGPDDETKRERDPDGGGDDGDRDRDRKEKKHRRKDKEGSDDDDRDRERGSSRRDKDRDRRRDRDRSRSKDRRRDKDRHRDRDRRRDKDRSRDRKDRDRDRSRDRRRRSRSRSRSHDRRRRRRSSRSRSRSGSRSRSASPVEMTAEERERARQLEEIEDLTKDQRTVFVSQLVMKADERGVRKFFEKVGKVKQVIMIRDKYTNRHKGFAYVEMKDLESIPLVLMLNGTVPDFQKFPILVKASEAEKNYLKKQETAAAAAAAAATTTGMAQGAEASGVGVGATQTRLLVENLDVHITEDDLRTVLLPFGEIETAELVRDEAGNSKGVAHVKFANPQAAATAIQKIGSQGLVLMDKAIKVSYVPDPAASANTGVPGTGGTWRLDDDEGRGMQMDAMGRAALMARLGQGKGLMPPSLAAAGASGAAAVPGHDPIAAARAMAAQAMVGGVAGVPGGVMPGMVPGAMPHAAMAAMAPALGTPTVALLIKNMFDPAAETEEGWDQDIKEDVEEECSKFGSVIHCHVDPVSPAGLSYVMFNAVEGAVKAAQHLNGRFFAGRSIAVEYLSPDVYAANVPGGAQAVAKLRGES